MLPRIKLSEALISNDNSHEDFMTIIDDEKEISRIKRKLYIDE